MGSAAGALMVALVAVLMGLVGMGMLMQMLMVVGMLMVMGVGMAVRMGMGNTVMGVLMGVGMFVGMAVAAHMIVVKMHSELLLRFFFHYNGCTGACQIAVYLTVVL